MIAEKLRTLPASIQAQGVCFQLQLFPNSSTELRLSYVISYVNKGSAHYKDYNEFGSWKNPFTGNNCSFLVLIEGITTDAELLDAIETVRAFLHKHLPIQ